ncbi:hypothetical protein CPB84DRAFT_1697017 [Gymnopilus junonius]|uniref:Uncharacterized protein n=1 Tax=Gymnopilus junonius TaxID=109634 RepID=A0A9P5TFK2_GYMJU|nr:hypothetical protein CPB84DRAFT_1697017 [Gymnopilus junonius]
MEMLQMLKFTMKGGKSLNFTGEMLRKDIEEYLQTLADEEYAVPEDIRGYIQSLLAAVE